MVVLMDAQWAVVEPLVEACRPHAKVPPSDLRRTVEAIIWRCTNGAKWRSILIGLTHTSSRARRRPHLLVRPSPMR